MKAIFDYKTLSLEKINIPVMDRAFRYGDGLFETMLVRNGMIRLPDYHYMRIEDGCKALKLIIPDNFTAGYIMDSVKRLCLENKLGSTARVKLQIWRKTGGKYEPAVQECHHLITVEKDGFLPGEPFNNVKFAKTVFNRYTPWSFFKRVSAMQYVMAGLEKKERSADNLIILDPDGHISEMLYSNIFWIKSGTFYTPSLETGCIRGVMRSWLLDRFRLSGTVCHEVRITKTDLLDAGHIFSANVSGLVPVTGIEDTVFREYPGLAGLTEDLI